MPGKAKVTYSETCGYCGTLITVEGDSSLINEPLFCPICAVRDFYSKELSELIKRWSLGIIK